MPFALYGRHGALMSDHDFANLMRALHPEKQAASRIE
jgi:hypothetical protein